MVAASAVPFGGYIDQVEEKPAATINKVSGTAFGVRTTIDCTYDGVTFKRYGAETKTVKCI